MDSAQPIIVKKIKKAGHAHHGGAWKVAFADFVTAMMAFFLLMWLVESTTPEERAAISDYFENPSAIQGPGGASTSMIKLGAVDQNLNKKSEGESTQTEKAPPPPPKVERVEVEKDKARLDNLKRELEKAIEASQALKPFKDQLLLDLTPEGLRIQIIDKEGRPMFDVGSASLKSYTEVILHEIAKLINTVPNHISLSGHTDATPYAASGNYSNWELSADRANASRRALIAGGLDETKIAKVVGLASIVPFIKTDPRSPMNRRISLIVMNKEAEAAMQDDTIAQVKTTQDAKQAISSAVPETTSPIAPDIEQGSVIAPVVTVPGAGQKMPTPLQSLPLKAPSSQPQVITPSVEPPAQSPASTAVPTPLDSSNISHTPRKSQTPGNTTRKPTRLESTPTIKPAKPIQLLTVPR